MTRYTDTELAAYREQRRRGYAVADKAFRDAGITICGKMAQYSVTLLPAKQYEQLRRNWREKFNEDVNRVVAISP